MAKDKAGVVAVKEKESKGKVDDGSGKKRKREERDGEPEAEVVEQLPRVLAETSLTSSKHKGKGRAKEEVEPKVVPACSSPGPDIGDTERNHPPTSHEESQDGDAGGTDDSGDSDGETDRDASAPQKTKSNKPKRQESENLDDNETQALSHAERRRQRKREQKVTKEQLDEEDELGQNGEKKRKLEDGSAIMTKGKKDGSTSTPLTRQNSVWVGNLSFKTTADDIKRFFSDILGEGGLGVITRINMPTKSFGGGQRGDNADGGEPRGPGNKRVENRGFAYVDFSTKEAKLLAISKSEQPLIGRKLLIKDGDDFSGRPTKTEAPTENGADSNPLLHTKTAQKILKAQKQPAAPTLFLGNLGFETKVEDIKQLFEAHRTKASKDKKKAAEDGGEDAGIENEAISKEGTWIRKVRMGTFEDSGLCKGFAFVDFVSIEEATLALVNLKNYRLNGRQLVVEYAGPDAVRRGANGGATKSLGKQRATESRSMAQVRSKPKEHEPPTDAMDVSTEDAAPTDRKPKSWSTDARPMKGPRHRPKPGAALALAKRESAAILPSSGKKTVF